jgi:hypothetical protein
MSTDLMKRSQLDTMQSVRCRIGISGATTSYEIEAREWQEWGKKPLTHRPWRCQPFHSPTSSRDLRNRNCSTVSTLVVMSALRSMPSRSSQLRDVDRSWVWSGRRVTT